MVFSLTPYILDTLLEDLITALDWKMATTWEAVKTARGLCAGLCIVSFGFLHEILLPAEHAPFRGLSILLIHFVAERIRFPARQISKARDEHYIPHHFTTTSSAAIR
jgi:hypothetical protein